MQIKFLTTLLLVGVCFTQVTFAHPHETEVQRNLIDDLIAQAKQAIEKIQNIIKENIDDALKTFDKIKDQVIQLGTDAIEKTSEKLKEIIDSAKKQIDDIINKAQEAGEDISPCLTDIDKRFEELFNELLQAEINCVTKEIDEAERIIDEAIKIVEDAYKSVEDLPEKLKACGSGLTSITCINKVIVEVAKLNIDLPGKITNKVNEITTFVTGLKVRVETCAVTEVANAGFATAGVVADVAKCAADLIGKPEEKPFF